MVLPSAHGRSRQCAKQARAHRHGGQKLGIDARCLEEKEKYGSKYDAAPHAHQSGDEAPCSAGEDENDDVERVQSISYLRAGF